MAGDYRPLCIVCEGINDIAAGTSGGALWNTVSQHLALMRRDGFKIFLCTLPGNSTITAAQDSERLAFNRLVVQNRNAYDYLVDLGTTFATVNGTDFNDGVHLSPTANTTFAQMVVAASPTGLPYLT